LTYGIGGVRMGFKLRGGLGQGLRKGEYKSGSRSNKESTPRGVGGVWKGGGRCERA